MEHIDSPILQHALLLEEAEQIARLGTFEWHLATDERVWTPGLWRVFGLRPRAGGPTLDEFLSCIHPDDRGEQRRLQARLMEDPRSWESAYRVVKPNGELAFVRTRGVLASADGRVVMRGTVQDVTMERLADEALRRGERRFRALTKNAPVGIVELDTEGRCVFVNERFCELSGIPAERTADWGWMGALDRDERETVLADGQRAARGGQELVREHRMIRADGKLVWISARTARLLDDSGAVEGYIVTCTDITEQKEANRAIEEAEERFRSAFDGAPIGMVITGLDGRFEHVNPALCEITGYSREQLEDMTFRAITPAEDLLANDKGIEQLVSGEISVYRTEKRYIHADGHLVPIEISATLVRDADGQPLNFITQIQDITERKLFEGRLRHLADHDPLTGLFNRRRFEGELARELALAERYQASAAVLAIDLDNFKYINDSLGHSIGDQLIARVGEALVARLRRTDVIARLGGDEFAVILPHADQDEASRVANALLEAVRAVDLEAIGSRGQSVTASIGISIFEPGSTLTAEELVVAADIAMYDAKEAGRSRATVYNAGEERGQRMQARITWTDRIREALADDRFVLYAQEIRSLAGDPVPRFELLLRMVSEDGEVILPGSFLHVAERFDLIQEIDRWVIRSTARILGEQQAAGNELVLSMNLSAKSITDPEVPLLIACALEEEGADARGLCLEVTETAAIVNVDRAKDFARAVGDLGCELSLDDFGAGFASFYYLKYLTFDVLKIDGEFVRGLPTSRMNQLLVKSVVDIARGLGKRTVAEFVGDAKTLELLREMGVDFAQGFHVGRPQPLEAVGLSSHIETRSSGLNPAPSYTG